MGYKKYATKGDEIDARRHEIIKSLDEYASVYAAVQDWAVKIGCSAVYIRRKIAAWKKEGLISRGVNRMSIAEFKQCWSEVREPIIITVARVDMFEAKPIKKG